MGGKTEAINSNGWPSYWENVKSKMLQNTEVFEYQRKTKMFWILEHFRFQNQIRYSKYSNTEKTSDIWSTSGPKHFT